MPPPRKPSNSVMSPMLKPRENSESRGTRVIWIGTICRAKTATNSQSLPLKSIQEKAYAASAASTSGMRVAGSEIAIELMNDRAMSSLASTVW
jgi:hypothetical protein